MNGNADVIDVHAPYIRVERKLVGLVRAENEDDGLDIADARVDHVFASGVDEPGKGIGVIGDAAGDAGLEALVIQENAALAHLPHIRNLDAELVGDGRVDVGEQLTLRVGRAHHRLGNHGHHRDEAGAGVLRGIDAENDFLGQHSPYLFCGEQSSCLIKPQSLWHVRNTVQYYLIMSIVLFGI